MTRTKNPSKNIKKVKYSGNRTSIMTYRKKKNIRKKSPEVQLVYKKVDTTKVQKLK